MRTLTLYGMALSTYCCKIQTVMRHKHIDYTMIAPPDGYQSDAYRAIVPMGTVPGLVDGDIVLSESEAIAEYLDEEFPEPPMIGTTSGERAQTRTLSRLHDCWIEPHVRALYPLIKSASPDMDLVRHHTSEFHRRLEQVAHAATPAPWIAGERFTLADTAWTPTLMQARLLFDAFGESCVIPVSLTPWHDRLRDHPAVDPVLQACESAMTDWIKTVTA